MNFSRLVNPYNHMQKFCQFVYVHIFLGMGSVTKKKKKCFYCIETYLSIRVCIVWEMHTLYVYSGFVDRFS